MFWGGDNNKTDLQQAKWVQDVEKYFNKKYFEKQKKWGVLELIWWCEKTLLCSRVISRESLKYEADEREENMMTEMVEEELILNIIKI